MTTNAEPLPTRIPVTRMEDEHTYYMGLTEDKRQFWAYNTFAFAKPIAEIETDDWSEFRNEYLVLHTFDESGNHINTRSLLLGTTADYDENMIVTNLEKWLKELGSVYFSDINIKLFNVNIEGVTFGLIPDVESGTIELQPSSTISFQAPWDGEYYT